MERWLSLTVSPNVPHTKPRKAPYFISIPKKIVRQAVRRNRIKRVLKEALRARGALPGGRVHFFKVTQAPEGVDLGMAKRALNELLR